MNNAGGQSGDGGNGGGGGNGGTGGGGGGGGNGGTGAAGGTGGTPAPRAPDPVARAPQEAAAPTALRAPTGPTDDYPKTVQYAIS
ncbi:hypothetical protein [Mycobacterium riyadhense]|uniref:hypothetical protein n=1 Tax=Mycobacterium riyadhense TaxID=486698 RepID=UPI00195D1282|nr:hypothetical protein [Mycobacterium riyadhense]